MLVYKLVTQATCCCWQDGLATVCLVGSSTTVLKAKIEQSIPKKRGAAAAGYERAIESFFDKVRPAHMPLS